jgi:hypothetical protein
MDLKQLFHQDYADGFMALTPGLKFLGKPMQAATQIQNP